MDRDKSLRLHTQSADGATCCPWGRSAPRPLCRPKVERRWRPWGKRASLQGELVGSEARQVRSDLIAVCMRSIRDAILGETHPVAVTAHYGDMARTLKVFRTPTGFHDAYVAAPSRKAALKAWGADVDLFARGAAEEVSDPGLMEEALARPGKVVRKVRGTMEEHFAALPDGPSRPSKATAKPDQPASRKSKAQPKPRPSRKALDAAEDAVDEAGQRYEAARRELTEREAALRAEREALETKHTAERDRLESVRNIETTKYQRALAAWRAGEG